MFIGLLLIFGRLDLLIPMDTLFEVVDEVRVGRLLMWWLLISFSLGIIPAMIQSSKERKFTDRWFLASGIVLLVIALVYLFGVGLK
jgi:hypothetical protein